MISMRLSNARKGGWAGLPSSFPERSRCDHVSLSAAILNRNGKNAIIAEIKCALTESRGHPEECGYGNDDRSPGAGRMYRPLGPHRTLFLRRDCAGYRARQECRETTVIRKDFIIDERQIAESRALGADAVLLIAAVPKEIFPFLLIWQPIIISNRSWKSIQQMKRQRHFLQRQP